MFYENYVTKIMDDHLKCYDFNELLKVFNKCKNRIKIKQLSNNKDFMFMKTHQKYNIFNEINLSEIPSDEMKLYLA